MIPALLWLIRSNRLCGLKFNEKTFLDSGCVLFVQQGVKDVEMELACPCSFEHIYSKFGNAAS